MKMIINSKGLFFLKFSSANGMNEVHENGPWILGIWSPNASLSKEDMTKIPVWEKLHNIPISGFMKDECYSD